jgi:hypothetical protein
MKLDQANNIFDGLLLQSCSSARLKNSRSFCANGFLEKRNRLLSTEQERLNSTVNSGLERCAKNGQARRLIPEGSSWSDYHEEIDLLRECTSDRQP